MCETMCVKPTKSSSDNKVDAYKTAQEFYKSIQNCEKIPGRHFLGGGGGGGGGSNISSTQAIEL